MKYFERILRHYEDGVLTKGELQCHAVRCIAELGVQGVIDALPKDVQAEFEDWMRIGDVTKHLTSNGWHQYPQPIVDTILRWRSPIDVFAALLQAHLDRLHGEPYCVVGLTTMKKRHRIWIKDHDGGTCVYMFVDIKTGDAFMPRSWSAPTRHVRGNISDPDRLLEECDKYHMLYLRESPHC